MAESGSQSSAVREFMGYAHSLGWALAPIAADAGAAIRKAVLVEADEDRAKAAANRLNWDDLLWPVNHQHAQQGERSILVVPHPSHVVSTQPSDQA